MQDAHSPGRKPISATALGPKLEFCQTSPVYGTIFRRFLNFHAVGNFGETQCQVLAPGLGGGRYGFTGQEGRYVLLSDNDSVKIGL